MASSSPISQTSKPFIQNPDGSVTRVPNFIPDAPPSEDHGNPYSALSRDVPISQEKRTWARIYIPKTCPENGSRLPAVVYVHGGGFVMLSAASTMLQKFCSDLSSQIPAVVVSLDYRLAPEHRLPSAYDDCLEALRWIDAAEEEWLQKYADLSDCFVMGSSAGGNIAYNVGLRSAELDSAGYRRMKIRGLILHQPYFGGVDRTRSETERVDDPVLPLHLNDAMWDLALPAGADRDHGYCNFAASDGYAGGGFGKLKEKEVRVLVTGCDGDPLLDRQRQLVEMLKGEGVDAVGDFGGGGFHGVETFDDDRAAVFFGVVKSFIRLESMP